MNLMSPTDFKKIKCAKRVLVEIHGTEDTFFVPITKQAAYDLLRITQQFEVSDNSPEVGTVYIERKTSSEYKQQVTRYLEHRRRKSGIPPDKDEAL